MKYKLKWLRRLLELIIANSKLWNITKSDYLQGELMNIIWRNIISMINIIKTIIGRLGK